jgi:glutathione-regulated potassium-efflux system ancillary protein KefG
MTAKILLLFAHPALERSRVNRRLFDAVREVPGVTAHDLYEVYPRFTMDVRREQALCESHDVIVFQHPFYWYSAPSLLKEWQDLVLELGWAYGPGGKALHGKVTFNVVTTGGAAGAYRPEGRNRFTMRQLLSPFDQTAHLCGMKFLAPLVVHGALSLASDALVKPHAERYVRAIEALRDGTLDLERAAAAEELAPVVDALQSEKAAEVRA